MDSEIGRVAKVIGQALDAFAGLPPRTSHPFAYSVAERAIAAMRGEGLCHVCKRPLTDSGAPYCSASHWPDVVARMAEAIRRMMAEATIPAAEYCPALVDIIAIGEKALQGNQRAEIEPKKEMP